MARMARSILLTAVLAATIVASPAAPAAGGDADVWAELRPLAGKWKGEGLGFGAVADVTHEWEFVLQSRFLRLRTRSVQRGENGEVHEDIGFVSRDTGSGTFVFRQFLSEGFVNTFDLAVQTGDTLTITFEPRAFESTGSMRARMELTLESADAYAMTLALAGPGKEFVTCQQMRMTRVP